MGAQGGGRGRHINRFEQGSRSQEGSPGDVKEAHILTDLTGDLNLKKGTRGGEGGGARTNNHVGNQTGRYDNNNNNK